MTSVRAGAFPAVSGDENEFYGGGPKWIVTPKCIFDFDPADDMDWERVVEADPYTRLSYTWHAFTPEWAQTVDVDESRRARLAAERRSKVTFEIEPIDGEQVKLTVIHDDLEPDGLLVNMISGGWPRVIANLKTLLETGEPLPDTRGRR